MKPVRIRHKAISFTLNQRFKENMSDLALYESARGMWKVGKRKDGAEYAIVIFKGYIREVYKIQAWHPAGTLTYLTRDISSYDLDGRWEFTGEVAEDIRDEYVGKYIGKMTQNPVRYWNC